MARKTPTTRAETPEASPEDCAAGLAWLRAELAKAEREEVHGPYGQGWTYNETMRAAVVERAKFLRWLVAGLE